MLAVIRQEKTPHLEDKLKKFGMKKMAVAKSVYKELSKGEPFIESLYKLMVCTESGQIQKTISIEIFVSVISGYILKKYFP